MASSEALPHSSTELQLKVARDSRPVYSNTVSGVIILYPPGGQGQQTGPGGRAAGAPGQLSGHDYHWLLKTYFSAQRKKKNKIYREITLLASHPHSDSSDMPSGFLVKFYPILTPHTCL